MKLFLLHLSVGLHIQDVPVEHQELIEKFEALGYIKLEGKVYRLNSKYRIGTIAQVQESGAYLKILGATAKDLFIESENLSDAKEGDLVIAQRLLGRRGKPQAKVLEIVGRAESYSVAFVKKVKGRVGLYDIRSEHPAGVEISDDELESFTEGDAFQVNNQSNQLMQKLGNIYDKNDFLVDEKIVLALYNKHDAFEEDVLEQAKSFHEVDASKHPHRKDIRQLDFCTIDPVTAKDYDDAICFDVKNSILYVAIADVSHYVKPFGAIDTEAIYRSFSIYLPHRSIPMLPRELSETLCSLQPHVDRLAYVFEIHLDKEDLSVTKSELYEALIHSKRRFNYEEIDAFFEGRLKAQNSDEERIFASLKELRKVTDRLKIQRLKVGYDFRSEELEMYLDTHGEIKKTEIADETPSHALIEDCMLLANKEAAARYDHGVFRTHNSPSQAKLETLYQELAGIGIMIDLDGDLKDIITNIQAQAREREIEAEVDTLIIRSQMQAKYTPDNQGHFGLGFERYTHFTSPIRRYSDLVVHRLLKAIQANDTEEGSYVLRNIDALCISISEKERESADVEFKFMDRKFARWAHSEFEKEPNKTFRARVIATDPELKAEIHDEIGGAKVFLKNATGVMLFDDIKVKFETINLATSKITASVVEKIEK